MTIFFIVSIILLIASIGLVIHAYKIRSNISLRTEFVSIISHKFRTPLTSVRWLTENLVQTEKDDFRKKDLQDIHILNQQLIDLTNTLIELADMEKISKEQYTFEEVSLYDVVNESAQKIKELAGVKNIAFNLACKDRAIKVKIDRARFEFIAHTILDNSVVYTKSGGKVDVLITSIGDKAVINVTDNGIGIAPNAIWHIFSEFYRAPNAVSFDTEGLGVDLFLAQKIAHRLGGEIRVSSQGENLGSMFELILPKVG